MNTPIALLTVKQAKFQDAIRPIYQPYLRANRWSADGCGDNLYRTASFALRAYKTWQLLSVVMTQTQLEQEHT